MVKRMVISTALMGSTVLGFLSGLSGCANAPVGERTPGTATGAGGGALAGAAIDRDSRGVGALSGAGLGEGAGWLIGAEKSKIDKKKADDARAAEERSRHAPATVEDVRRSETADLNGDGFVTLDEVVAMQKAGLSDREMTDRLQRTDQVFQLTDRQQDYLKDRGVSQEVIGSMLSMNRGYQAPLSGSGEAGNAGNGSKGNDPGTAGALASPNAGGISTGAAVPASDNPNR